MKKGILSLFSFLIVVTSFAQNVLQPSGSGLSSVNRCGNTFYDNGGSGSNYSNNCNSMQVICPSIAGQFVQLTFTSFDLENGWDYMIIRSGDGVANPGAPMIGSYTGTTSPGTITSSSADGCLTIIFYSDGFGRRPGWSATISCSATAGAAPSTGSQNCGVSSGQTICDNTTLTGNSSGSGAQELLAPWDGCLNKEHQSSWYYFSPSSGGTVEFTLNPSGADDYDFAIWGPYTEISCPDVTSAPPIRCSYADATSAGYPTGLAAGAGDNSEGAGGDGFVNALTVNAGEVYVMVIDNFSSSSNPFDLTWNLSGGASLDCTILPVELIAFYGISTSRGHDLFWTTATETNNAYFEIQRSSDGINFTTLDKVDGAGNSVIETRYNFVDEFPLPGINYYRLRQVDFDQHSSISNIITLTNTSSSVIVQPLSPNPSNGNVSLSIFSKEKAKGQLYVQDITGKTIYEQGVVISENWSKHQLDLSFLSNGCYFISITTANSLPISQQKWVKQ